jgi:ribonuclease BN (tRNA processing enzyme)
MDRGGSAHRSAAATCKVGGGGAARGRPCWRFCVQSGFMARSPAVQLAPAVWRIPTVGRSAVNSFAFVDGDGSVTLVDCGLKKAPARIVAGLAAIGKTPADVTRILLTHAHADHASGAA